MSNDPVRSGTESSHKLRNGRAVKTPSFDDLFDILSESRRRYALYVLQGADGGLADVETLADEVSMLEARADDATLTESLREDVAEELRETHLPRLAAADVVEYDPRSDVARYWQQPTLEEYLEHTRYKEFRDG